MENNNSLKNKRIVIIGGSSGIGFATAQAALAEDAEVIVASRSVEKLNKARDRLDKAIQIETVDIEDEAQLISLFKKIGNFDHLQLPASEVLAGNFLTLPMEQAKKTFSSKFWGAYQTVQCAHPYINNNGSITLFSGRLSQRPTGKNIAILAAVNSAVEGLARALAVELAPIRVNTLCPGITKTELFDKLDHEHFTQTVTTATQESIIKRMAQPAEIAVGAIYLMRSMYTTGSTLVIDGGFTFR